MHKSAYLLLASAGIVLMTIMSLVETVSLSNNSIPYSDKILHALAYLAITLLWIKYAVKAFAKTKTYKILTIVCLTLFVYGIVIEVMQSMLTENRVSELADLIANCLGIMLAIVIFKTVNKHKLKNNKGLFF